MKKSKKRFNKQLNCYLDLRESFIVIHLLYKPPFSSMVKGFHIGPRRIEIISVVLRRALILSFQKYQRIGNPIFERQCEISVRHEMVELMFLFFNWFFSEQVGARCCLILENFLKNNALKLKFFKEIFFYYQKGHSMSFFYGSTVGIFSPPEKKFFFKRETLVRISKFIIKLYNPVLCMLLTNQQMDYLIDYVVSTAISTGSFSIINGLFEPLEYDPFTTFVKTKKNEF